MVQARMMCVRYPSLIKPVTRRRGHPKLGCTMSSSCRKASMQNVPVDSQMSGASDRDLARFM